MRKSICLSTVLGAVLLLSGAAWAQLSMQSAHVIGGELTTAYLTITQVERQVKDSVGKAPSATLKDGLALIDRSVAKAEALANSDSNLAPGLTRVREVVNEIKGAARIQSAHVTLVDEASIKLYAMQINANILEAASHLRAALGNIGKNMWQEQIMHLDHAVDALQLAAEHGGYHIENDIEELESELARMKAKMDRQIPLDKGNVEARIEEIEAHLFDLNAMP